MSLQGKIALITGGSRGIGAASASLLAARGAAVALSYRHNAERAAQTVAAIEAAGGQALAIQADAQDAAQTQHLVAATLQHFGRLDIVVSNAPMGWIDKPFRDLGWEEYRTVVDLELKAAYDLTQAVLPTLTAQKSGRLIYMASGLARSTRPGYVASGTAKSALITLVRYLAQELGPEGITANAIAPGMVETEINAYMPEPLRRQLAAVTPLRRLGQPDDVAGVVAFLASDDSRFVTGSVIHVSGGLTMD